ncbi:MAG: RnfABCDGE type electron transport complex subunit D [Oscillospiraceae bacterium]|nr:RnfABCDGE type electron transport complex subunit D [Oscillospiraceae bacterium]
MKKFVVHSAPHTNVKTNTLSIMGCVILALLPTAIAGCVMYQLPAVFLLMATTGTAFLTDLVVRALFRRDRTAPDGSAAVTGLILGLSLPPSFPVLWAIAGSAFAIIIVKELFDGIGKNFANPALTARMLLMVLCMEQMHTWTFPDGTVDAVSGATPLVQQATLWDLFLGNTAGCIGETCAAAILLGGIYLYLSGIISPAAPLAYLGSFALLTWLGGYPVLPQLLSGSLLFCAVFAATDYTTTPITKTGKVLFGIGCGCITYFARHYGGYAEGAGFAILIMNLFVPLLDRIAAPGAFGAAAKRAGK